MFETLLIEILGETLYMSLVEQNPELLSVFILIFTFMLLMLIFGVIRSMLTFGGRL